MKTKKRNRNRLIFSGVLLLSAIISTNAQELKIIEKLPSLDVQNQQEHQYEVVTDYYYYTIYGDFTNKLRISGKYTSGLPNQQVRWNDVRLAKSSDYKGEFSQGTPLKYMENFTYDYKQNILSPEFFKDIPNASVEAKNLVWDMAGIEFFAWGSNDSLKLNVPYHSPEANGKQDLAGMGFFDNRDIVLTWKGFTEKDGEELSMIDFRTFNNPLEVKVDLGDRSLQTKGRSHYWGTIWLANKLNYIDHVQLFEDVVMEISWSDQAKKNIVDAVREMNVTKIY